MKKFGMPAAILVLFAILFSGCEKPGDSKDIRESTLVIDSSGGVNAYLVERFDKNYYSLAELTSMAQMQVTEFVGSATESKQIQLISVDTVQDDSSRVIITYQFDKTGSYERFTGDKLFYGTVAEAVQRGYNSDMVLQSVKDGSPLTTEELLQKLEQHLVVYYPVQVNPEQVKLNPEAEEIRQMSIDCPATVEYVSEGVVVNQDGSITISWVLGSEYDPVYILLRK